MAITIRIPPWHSDDPITHVSTTWRIYGNANKTDLKHETVEDTNSLTEYTVGLVLPVDIIWHCIATMHFSDGTSEETPIIVADYANIIDYNTIHKPYIVDKPIVNTDLTKVYNNGECNLTINTSVFRVLDEDTRRSLITTNHLYTHWIIIDKDDTVLYASMYNEDKRTEITIPKNVINNFNVGNIKILAIHGDEYGSESEIGYIDLTVEEL